MSGPQRTEPPAVPDPKGPGQVGAALRGVGRMRRAWAVGRGVLASRLLGRHRPLFLGAVVTDRCDAACRYCRRAGPEGEDLPTARWLDLLHQAAAAGCLRLSFTGGEPLVRQDLPHLVRRAREHGMQVHLNTNGGLLPERIADLAGLSGATVSLDGPEAIMDAVRGPGSHARAIRGIEAARSVGLAVTLHATLSSANVHRIDEIVAEARRLELRVNMAPVTPTPLGGRGDHHYPAPASFRRAMRYLLDLQRAGDSTVLSSRPCLEHLSGWPEPRTIPCAAGRIYARIEPDGRLYTCGDRLGQEEGISCLEGGLAEAFRRLPPAACDRCWCDTRVEMNLVYGLTPRALRAARDR